MALPQNTQGQCLVQCPEHTVPGRIRQIVLLYNSQFRNRLNQVFRASQATVRVLAS